jgi:hydroxymethylpyrimidine/phosphomethylpyrimidine kinase
MKIALTIAGSDSGGGAGIQADLLTFAAHGVHGVCAVAAVTAQSSVEVADWEPMTPGLVVRQIETLAADMPIAAAKTGMLGTPEILQAVAEYLRACPLPFLVVDPVMVSTGGDRLALRTTEPAYLGLLPLATVVTPNLPEACALLGRPVRTLADMHEAAQELVRRGARAVVIKGGHLEGDAVDVYFDGQQSAELRAPRIDTPHTHGTGCTFSAAITARLATGVALWEAVEAAKAYVTEAIRGGYAVGRGPGVLDHLHPLRTVAMARDRGRTGSP